MKTQQMAKLALVAGALLVALVVAGLPVASLGFLVLILACPLMMFFMMRGMGGMGHGAGGRHDDVHDHDHDVHDHDRAGHGRPGER